ncbi:hypothetical protein BUALT_Bualt02G0054400 [Buddleja alternifolia]|uniref:Homeobox domain-containing protein n=1 Tax=Buddleja alternifolia TaxID=168488 RepID=A0AAV6XXL5_9LAMI|nr:hypothetical protein BUALT_Bualt02G0054400 [Buddleja alternifolia]
MSPSPSTTRWCPTPEQLMILEEMYRRGVRTPNASQIQKITAHLATYGKIQGKNVFYWFQNHKARDRQKLRKKLAKQLHQHHLLQYQPHHHQTLLFNPNHNNHTLDFHYYPSAFHQFSITTSCSPELNLPPQGGSEVYKEEVPADAEAVMKQQTWMTDLPKDCFIRSYGHDSMMIMDVGPTFPCRSNSNSKRPLQTLELFPLTSHKNPKTTTS